MFSGAPDRAPVPGDPRVPPGASPSTSPIGAPSFDSSTSASRSQRQASWISFFFLFFLTLSYPSAEPRFFVLLLILTFC